MASWGIQILAVITVCIFLQNETHGAMSPERKACLKKSRLSLKKYMKLFGECNKEMGSYEKTGEEFANSIGCVVKCIMKKDGFIGDDGQINNTIESLNEVADFPEDKREKAQKHFMVCIDNHGGADSLDNDDPDCVGYASLGMCMQEAISDICD